jgi:peptidoglycan hydrolase-like protein with peptidoglycan-binding domain
VSRWLGLGALALAVAAVALVAAVGGGDEGGASSDEATVPTVAVERRNLRDRLSVDGTLGYAGSAAVINRLVGTVTWQPATGAVIRPGGKLFEVDNRPVILFDGAVPAYRDLETGVARGPDVAQLERGLDALGFDDGGSMTVDRSFTEATAAAVRDWQASLGLKETGRVALGRVVFLQGARRVTSLQVELGSSGGSSGTSGQAGAEAGAAAVQVMTTSSTRLNVSVDLDASDQALAEPGRAVEITLPNGQQTSGRIRRVGTVATTSQSDGSTTTGEESGEATINVTIAITDSKRVPDLDQAPVTVDLTRKVRRSVLAVPVSALIATEGGDLAVVVNQGGQRRTVTVETGLFASGYVEVKGRLSEGDRVEVPE